MAKEKNGKPENSENEEKNDVERQESKGEKVVWTEIDKIRLDVSKLSQELKTTVTELKKSIVDIRSAVSEIENPFNLLRVITSEKDLKKLNSERLPPGVKSLVLGKPEESAPEEEGSKEKPEEKPLEPQPPELAISAGTKHKVERFEPQTQQQPQPELPKTGLIYLDWVWALLDLGLSSDEIRQLAHSYEFMGYLPSRSSMHIYSLAIASEKARSKGLTKSQLLLSMFKAAAISGIKIGSEDAALLISIVEGG